VPARLGQQQRLGGAELGDRGHHREHHRQRPPARGQQQGAQFFAQRRAAGLTGRDDIAPLCAQIFNQPGMLGAFAGAINAFKGDKPATHRLMLSFLVFRHGAIVLFQGAREHTGAIPCRALGDKIQIIARWRIGRCLQGGQSW